MHALQQSQRAVPLPMRPDTGIKYEDKSGLIRFFFVSIVRIVPWIRHAQAVSRISLAETAICAVWLLRVARA
jgi:hypothetical protein